MKTSMNNKGFTLVETLVAITILMISIAGPLTIAQKSLNAATYAKNQVIASFLAQDAIESIKNDRDNTAYATWKEEVKPNPASCKNCIIERDFDSKFTRTISATDMGKYVKVTANIVWYTGTIKNSFTLENHLYNVSL